MFGKLFGKKISEGKAKMKKIENQDIMEAIVGGNMLMAAVSGGISDNEIKALNKQVMANKNLSHFGAEIGKAIDHFESVLQSGYRLGKLEIFGEIEDIKHNPKDAELVFVNMITMAEEDGEIDEKEMGLLKEVAQLLGLSPADYGL